MLNKPCDSDDISYRVVMAMKDGENGVCRLR